MALTVHAEQVILEQLSWMRHRQSEDLSEYEVLKAFLHQLTDPETEYAVFLEAHRGALGCLTRLFALDFIKKPKFLTLVALLSSYPRPTTSTGLVEQEHHEGLPDAVGFEQSKMAQIPCDTTTGPRVPSDRQLLAMNKVFDTPELFGHISLLLPAADLLLHVRGVCKAFRFYIDKTSPFLRATFRKATHTQLTTIPYNMKFISSTTKLVTPRHLVLRKPGRIKEPCVPVMIDYENLKQAGMLSNHLLRSIIVVQPLPDTVWLDVWLLARPKCCVCGSKRQCGECSCSKAFEELDTRGMEALTFGHVFDTCAKHDGVEFSRIMVRAGWNLSSTSGLVNIGIPE